jgi:hypothetical protein
MNPQYMEIVVTDLTRFSREVEVCTAGTHLETGACIRPMPYLRMEACHRLSILPGSILRADFKPVPNLVGPHQEDASYKKMEFVGPCSPAQFRQALTAGLFESVEDGFQLQLAATQKYLPADHEVSRSIITLAIAPQAIQIVEDGYKPGKIKAHVTDPSGHHFRYLPITDLGFFRYAERHHAAQDLQGLNAFIQSQQEVLVRIGLSRAFESRGIKGYWMQLNGIYTFPDFFRDIRCYR